MHKTLKTCIWLSLCGLLALGIAGYGVLNADSDRNAAQQTTEAKTPRYTFSQYEGRLALYERGYAMPVEIYDVYLDTFPEEDQQRIRAGIPADSDTDIQKIIEDYTS